MDVQHHKHTPEKFLHVCLLVILSDQPNHGYELMNGLTRYGFDAEAMNIGSLYRELRKMEQAKLISSSWEKSSQGPRKRIYQLTTFGKEELNSLIQVIEERKNKIELILSDYLKGKTK